MLPWPTERILQASTGTTSHNTSVCLKIQPAFLIPQPRQETLVGQLLSFDQCGKLICEVNLFSRWHDTNPRNN